jgi:glycosyltransferase involved in cell wall biosynthesis
MAQGKWGLDVSVLSTWRNGDSMGVVEHLRSRLGNGSVKLVGPTRGLFRSHPQLSASCQTAVASCDVVHVHGVWEEIQYQAVRHAIAALKPVVWAPHGMFDPWSLAQGKWKKKLYWWWRWRKLAPKIDATHFITHSESRLAATVFGLGFREIIEPLGTTLPQPCPRGAVGRQVLFLSRLHPKKNLECLLEACASPVAEPWSLTIAGSGDAAYQKSLQARVLALGIEDRVVFVGDLRGPKKDGQYANADLFCLPSHQENFGIVVIEALAHGVPVLLSPAVGLAEDLAGEAVVRVIGGGPNEWALAIDSALGDSRLRQDAATVGPALVNQRFSWEAIASRWHAHYANLALARGQKTLSANRGA